MLLHQYGQSNRDEKVQQLHSSKNDFFVSIAVHKQNEPL